MSSDSPLITRVDLGGTHLHGSLISDELYRLIHEYRAKGEKLLLLYNRRGSGRAWICEDCGYFSLCPHCDIALAYHTSPKKSLICHHCGYRCEIEIECPKCHGHRFQALGIGLQKVATDLATIFPDMEILRIDSDAKLTPQAILESMSSADIILATFPFITLIEEESIHAGVFLLFESDLTFPDYRMEEDLYHTLSYAKKSKKHVLIQTYTPHHPLLDIVMDGNYRDFLTFLSRERKAFDYPPFTELVEIRIHDERKEKVEDIRSKLVNKIQILKGEDIFLSFDIDVWDRYAGEWIQKIILKGKNLESILDALEVEIVRNRSVHLHRR